MDDLISKLSEIRSDYNCFNEDEEPQYRALSEAIRILSQRADGDTISRQAAIDCVTCDVEHTIGCLKALLPAAPTTTQTTETTAPTTETTAPTTETTAPTTDDWITVEIDVEELKKVLEFEPLNIKTDGSIDRKTVIDFLSGTANLDPKVTGSLVMYVMSLPDIQPEHKTGEWILKDDKRYHCSVCDGIAPKGYRWSFCPNCGADMRKENES